MAGGLGAGEATAKTETYYLKVEFNDVSGIAMTDYNGGLWALRQVGEGSGAKYYYINATLGSNQAKTGEITIKSAEWYRESTCTNKIGAGEKANISAGTVTLYFQGTRARFVQKATQPTDATFSADFGTDNPANTKKAITLDVAAGGAVTMTKVWASIAGENPDAIPTLGAEANASVLDTYSASNDIGDYSISNS